MNITQELMVEHRLINKINQQLIDLLEIKSRISNKDYFSFISRFVNFIENFVDGYHHVKEEEFLFEGLDLPGVLDNRSPTKILLHEHELAREALGLIKQGLEQSNHSLIEKGVRNYVDILSQHMEKEDCMLYPLAEKSLGEKTKERINQLYVEAEQGNDKSDIWGKQTIFSDDLAKVLD
ncbi:hemerythrin domain-containing protein [Aliikangiella sp. IMCC44359]|uniref:hemerythrin domain-containing protein n=1 Tax=Aliikangiella sp. IMCC44359 TaxID=3459125 RepID=UPI00403A852F